MEELEQVHGGAVAALNEIITQRGSINVFTVTDPRTERECAVASVPIGRALVSLRPHLDEYLVHPVRRKGTVTLVTQDAFIKVVERYKGKSTVIFADPSPLQPSLTAVFNYHEQGSTEQVDDGGVKAGWGDHRAHLALRMSPEWQAWMGKDGRPMPQDEFAAFIADRIGDCVLVDMDQEPTVSETIALLQARYGGPSALMNLSRGLEVRQQFTVKNAVTLEDGSINLTYAETQSDAAGAPLTTPNLFFITIPIFYAGERYRVAVRLRYRIRNSQILWSFHLYRPERSFESAFAELRTQVESETALPVLPGTPE